MDYTTKKLIELGAELSNLAIKGTVSSIQKKIEISKEK